MNMNKTLITLAVASSLTIGGCSTYTIDKGEEGFAKDQEMFDATLAKQGPLINTSGTVTEVDQYYLGGEAFLLDSKVRIPDNFYQNISFNQLNPVSFQELINILSTEAGFRIEVSSDAALHLDVISRLGGGNNTKKKSIMEDIPDGDNVIVTEPITADIVKNDIEGATGSSLEFTFQYEGTVKGALDTIMDRVGLFWRWEGNKAKVFRTETKTFIVDILGNQSEFEAEVSSGFTGSNSGSKSLSKHKTKVKIEATDTYKELMESIKSLASGEGRFNLIASTGTLTVTDVPSSIDAIAEYIENFNDAVSQNIFIRTDVYEISIEENGDFGIDYSVIKPGSNESIAFNTLFNPVGGNNLSLTVTDPTSAFVDSAAMLNALNKMNNVSLVTTSTNYTVNGEAVPVQVIDEIHYVSEVSSKEDATTSDVNITLSTESIPSGFTMSLLPRITSNNEVLMKVAIDMSQLKELVEFGNGDTKVQLPNRGIKNFMQNVSVPSGKSLLISGYDRVENRSETDSVGHSDTWMLGGRKTGGQRKVRTLIVITPYIMTGK